MTGCNTCGTHHRPRPHHTSPRGRIEMRQPSSRGLLVILLSVVALGVMFRSQEPASDVARDLHDY